MIIQFSFLERGFRAFLSFHCVNNVCNHICIMSVFSAFWCHWKFLIQECGSFCASALQFWEVYVESCIRNCYLMTSQKTLKNQSSLQYTLSTHLYRISAVKHLSLSKTLHFLSSVKIYGYISLVLSRIHHNHLYPLNSPIPSCLIISLCKASLHHKGLC